MLNKTCTRTAKSAPYPPCTVTVLWLKYQDPARCLRRVTQPPHIAGPLAVMVDKRLLTPMLMTSFSRYVNQNCDILHRIIL